jgi:hypothetical protein
VEFVIVRARLDPERKLGVELEAENESPNTADIFRNLHLDRSRHPIEPLLQGECADFFLNPFSSAASDR